MSKNSTVDAQVGQAWDLLRQGKPQEAINSFEKVLQSIPNNVDAHYGLGLAQRASGQNADALETFEKASEIAAQMLEAIRSQVGGDDAANSLETTEDDRYMMLSRMLQQRVAELKPRPAPEA